MRSPIISRKFGGRRYTVFAPGLKRHELVCKRCGAVGHDLVAGFFADQWAMEHLRAAHPDTYASDSRDLYGGTVFDMPLDY
jgi:hypothetical protein